MSGKGVQIYVNGNNAYVLAGGVMIFDISNPATPVLVGNIAAPPISQPWESFAVTGNYIYLGGLNNFEIVDVSNPAQPVVTGTLANGTNGASLDFVLSIAIFGNYAFAASGNGNAIEVIDISNPAAPSHAGIITNGQGGALLSDPNSITVAGNYAYVTSRFSNALEILDINNPAAPVHLASLSSGQGGASIGAPMFVTVTSNLAYIACYSNIEIADVTIPGSPTHKGGIADGASGNGAKLEGASALVVSGNYAYIQSTGSGDLEVVDISNPTSPTHFSSLYVGGSMSSLFRSGNFLYFDMGSAINIIDISDPLSPVTKGFIMNGQGGAVLSEVTSICVSGNYAYAVSINTPGTLEIIDISNPSSPIHSGSSVINPGNAPFSNPNAVVVSGNYAFVADFVGLIEVFDVHDPTAPVQVATISDGQGGAMLSGPWSLVISGNYLYVASGFSNAVEIIDISNPLAPSHIASITAGQGGAKIDFPQSITASGNYVFVQSADYLEVVDVTDPHHPLHAGSLSVLQGGYTQGNNTVAVQGNYVYITGENNMQVISIFSPIPVVATAATSVSPSGFIINWNAVAGATSYQVDVSTNNFNTRVAGYDGVSASGTSFQVTGLTEYTTYQYRVRSVNAIGSSLNSNIISVTTSLAVPVPLSASNVTQTSFTANWNAVAGATSYQVDIALDPSFNTILVSATTSDTSLAVYQRHDSSTYWLRVRAQNAQFISGNSYSIEVLTLQLQQQTIAISLGNVVIGDSPFTLKAKASSGLQIKYSSSDTTVVAVKDSTFTIKKIGPCTITASQPGDSIYYAVSVNHTICVNPPQPTITQGGSEPKLVLTSSAASGNQWYFNGAPIPSATGQTIAVDSSGNYTTLVNREQLQQHPIQNLGSDYNRNHQEFRYDCNPLSQPCKQYFAD